MTRIPYVLVVEDDEWQAEQHVRTLEAGGMQAHYVSNALMAINELDIRQPDVLVLDVLLPGPNAFTLLHEIHSYSDLVTVPVILCTNSADRLKLNDLALYGVKRVLDKTIMHPRDLVAAVRKVLL